MAKVNIVIIQPSIDKPIFVKKRILYPKYLAEAVVCIPRVIGRPRKYKVFLLVDGCTGQTLRADSWPNLKSIHDINEDIVSFTVSEEDATIYINDYAAKKIARRYFSYWEPYTNIINLKKVYKIFWMTNSDSVVDSLSARKLMFSK